VYIYIMEYLSLYGMECRTIPRVLHNISLKFGKQSYNIFLLSLVLLNNKLLNYKEHINMQELTLTTPSLLFSAVSLILLAYTNLSPGKAKITIIKKGAKHPYHLIYQNWAETHVYGWVDEGTFSK